MTIGRRTLVAATVTPLASIFGSGFLIIVPVLEGAFGRRAVFAVALVCAVALLAGVAVRHNIRYVEGAAAGDIGMLATRLRTTSAATIALAYAVSVALYLQIMAAYALGYLEVDSQLRERVLSSAVIALLVAVGVSRGFSGLARLETIALGVTLAMIVALLAAFGNKVVGLDRHDLLRVPGSVDGSLFSKAALLGGILIAVQGFETSRYLGAEYARDVRIRASRWSQYISSVVYVALVLVCTPLMATAIPGLPADNDLLELARRTVPLLALPLALTGVFSQFSAAIADLVTAVGNITELSRERLRQSLVYLLLGIVSGGVVWIFSTPSLIAVASRAFAVFYAVQCLTAARTARSRASAIGFLALAGGMVFIVLFARAVG